MVYTVYIYIYIHILGSIIPTDSSSSQLLYDLPNREVDDTSNPPNAPNAPSRAFGHPATTCRPAQGAAVERCRWSVVMSSLQRGIGSPSKMGIFYIPRCSTYGIFTYIWAIFRANVGKYSIHGSYGISKTGEN